MFLASLRGSLIVLFAIPLSLLGGFAAMWFTGNTINAMTLGGLALALGILIDQAIVVVENVVRHLRLGKPPGQAALDGAREVALPILVATLTFVVVFYPVVFLTGMAGSLFRPLALAVTAATLTSFVLATTFVPVCCAVLLKKSPERASMFERWAARYRGAVTKVQRWRWPVLGATALLFCGSAACRAGAGHRNCFPPVDSGQFTILMRAPAGTRIERTEELTAEVEKVVEQVVGGVDPGGEDPESDLQLLIGNIGVLYDWPAAYTPNTGPMDAFLLVQLKGDRRHTAQQHAAALRQVLPDRFPGIDFAFDTGGMLTAALNLGTPSPIDIKVQGTDLKVIHEIARAIAREVRDVPGAVDVRVAQPLDYPALKIEVDRTKAGLPRNHPRAGDQEHRHCVELIGELFAGILDRSAEWQSLLPRGPVSRRGHRID